MSWDTPATDADFRRVYERHGGDILSYCRRRLGPDDAHDALAETFAVAWRRRDEMPGGQHARMWLYGVARNVVRNTRRGQNRRSRLFDRLRGVHEPRRDGPADLAERASEQATVLEALSTLRPSDQEILRLHAWEDLGRVEIAQVLGITPAAADMRLLRAIRRMSAAMEAADLITDVHPRAASEGGAR